MGEESQVVNISQADVVQAQREDQGMTECLIRLNDMHFFDHKIGTGSFGTVYPCKFCQSEEIFAVKCIDKAKMQEAREQLRRELSLLQSASHPFIVGTAVVLEDAAYVYLVTEYLPGGDFF